MPSRSSKPLAYAVLTAAAVAATSGALIATPAEAKKGKVNIVIGLGADPYIGTYGMYQGNSCHWLKKKAIMTGSSYWWHKYKWCLAG